MRTPLALALALASVSNVAVPLSVEPRSRVATCPCCGTRPYRAGLGDWFCGRCAKVVEPRFA